jgi:hypothetical protein
LYLVVLTVEKKNAVNEMVATIFLKKSLPDMKSVKIQFFSGPISWINP